MEETKKNIPVIQFYFQIQKMSPSTHRKHNLPLAAFLLCYEKLVGERYSVCAYVCVFVPLQLIYATNFRLV